MAQLFCSWTKRLCLFRSHLPLKSLNFMYPFLRDLVVTHYWILHKMHLLFWLCRPVWQRGVVRKDEAAWYARVYQVPSPGQISTNGVLSRRSFSAANGLHFREKQVEALLAESRCFTRLEICEEGENCLIHWYIKLEKKSLMNRFKKGENGTIGAIASSTLLDGTRVIAPHRWIEPME